MTDEEALDVLMNKIQIDVKFTEDFNRDYDCLTKCKEALEKRIQKKPEDCNGERMCECGNIVKSYQKYCSECGQKIDWSEIDWSEKE